MNGIPFGWWLTIEHFTILKEKDGSVEVDSREAILYSALNKLQRASDRRVQKSQYTLMGFTSDPAVVIAWINDGVIPPKEAPVRGS